MIDLAVEVHWTKSADVDVRRKLGMNMAIAAPTAQHIRRRMTRGRTATPGEPYQGPRRPLLDHRFKPPIQRERRYYITREYAAALGLGDLTRWESSAELHAQIGGVAGYATGGMWAGLQVKNYGNRFAIIDFARSSLGSSSVRRELKVRTDEFEIVTSKSGRQRKRYKYRNRRRGEEPRYSRKPRKVRNDEKAGRLFMHRKINAVQPTRAEIDAMFSAVARQSQRVVLEAFDSELIAHGESPGDTILFRAINKAMERL